MPGQVGGDSPCAAMAIGAHPDDIEFLMAGTLLLLKQAGAQIHMLNIANGCCGTTVYGRDEIVAIRAEEARRAAALAGATLYPALADDMAIFYEPGLLAQVAAVIRAAKPDILLVPSPQDYMEDHQNACRLAVTAAFARGMRNFAASPAAEPWEGQTVIYHAMPWQLLDPLRRAVRPGLYVDVKSVHGRKTKMLAEHRSQKEWIDRSQGYDAYLLEMEQMSRRVGAMSGRFELAEGWRRHMHAGFGPEGYDPLSEMLGPACWVDPDYEEALG